MTTTPTTTALADQIIEVAHHFSGPAWARAAGGNASYKEDGILYIKPSGAPLKGLAPGDLVPLRIDVLTQALHRETPPDVDPVRLAADQARVGFDDGRRPSVEILFHALLPEPLVVHLHPPVVNAITCNTAMHQLAADLFGDQVVVVDYTDPGVTLARAVEQARAAYTARTGAAPPGLTLLGNHGLIAAGRSAAELIELVEQTAARIQALIDAHPVAEPVSASRLADKMNEDPSFNLDENRRVAEMIQIVGPHLRGLLGTIGALTVVTSDASPLVRSQTRLGSPMVQDGPLIPDQIIYAGTLPCVVEPRYAPLDEQVTEAVTAYRAAHGRDPVIVVMPGKVVFAAGADYQHALNALHIFTDALQVASEANRLGRVRTMDPAECQFIETWEAEAYRRKVEASASRGRMQSKVVFITGAAQGFGLGIAQGLAAQGAHVVLADQDIAAAQAEADGLQAEYGPGWAMAVQVDVRDESSLRAGLAQVLAAYGGLDVYIANGSIARTGSIAGARVEDFDLVTDVNYKGYFLGVRTVAPVLAAQHAVRPDLLFDIVEINSRAGLRGSRRDFAYSGSQFGNIGLTQSFALELIESGVKVNAICPGDFLDGPLWSDPEKGLFVQYLRAGRVPGASSVADVRRYFQSRVPISRGCSPQDVVSAVLYLVEQQYETGQALPVTGGAVMMS